MKVKKLIVLLFLCFNLSATAQTTVLIRPHFNGKEGNIGRVDNICAPSDHRIDSPYAASPILSYMSWTTSGCNIFTRQLICFTDLTNHAVIPAGSTIIAAKLYLYGIPSAPTGDFGNSTYPGSPYSAYGTNKGWIYELASSFNASTVSWNTQPNVLHTDSVAVPFSTSRWGATDSLNVTSLVRHLFTSGNYGFLIKGDSEIIYREHLYASSRNSNSALHPALKVTFIPPTAIGTVNNFPKLVISPNPSHTVLHISCSVGANAPANITVYNALGQIVYRQANNLNAGANEFSIPINDWRSGMYVFELQNESGKLRESFLKE